MGGSDALGTRIFMLRVARALRGRESVGCISHFRMGGHPNGGGMSVITPNSVKGTGAPSGTQSTTNKNAFNLKPEDFIKMMVTQLQNQDPTAPAKNEELLAQMSQIGQLQSTSTLTDSIQTMVLQNQIGASSNLIGKNVEGLDDQDQPVKGIVNSVRVEDKNVVLELDNGNKLQLGRVTSIAGATAAGTGTIAAGTGATTGRGAATASAAA
jgi:flagellar basal-body rod modification protein FlgD